MAWVMERPFADGVYPFRLGSGEWRELQRICDAGPMEIYRRLLAGTWRIDDVIETHRLGLLGAARKGQTATVRGEPLLVTPAIAVRLTAEYVDCFGAPFLDPDGETTLGLGDLPPLTHSSLLAAEICAAGLMGSKDEPLGKKQEGETSPSETSSPTAGSDGEASSPPSPIEE